MRYTFHAGEQVGHGFYLGLNHLEQVTFGQGGGELPGGEGGTWLRIPWLLVAALAPVVGLVFFVTMPAIGVALVLKVVAEAALRETWRLVRPLVAAVTPPLREQAVIPRGPAAPPATRPARRDLDDRV